ncbi:MAG: type 1 glutamine amidotransferase [Solirubrobacteraceae bacterium]
MSVETIDTSTSVATRRRRAGAHVRRRWVLPARNAARDTVAVLQFRDDVPGGLLLDVLAEHGLRAGTVRVDRDEPLPDPRSLALGIVLGTANSVVYNRASRWLEPELEWIRRADRAGTAVLGLGSGAHALATALGGGVEPARQPRRGWIRVETTTPDVIARGPWLAWNEGLIQLPPGAQLLAHDRVGPQAFSLRGHLCVQFHPEVKPETVAGWVSFRRGEPLDGQAVLEATSREQLAAAAASRQLLAAFIDRRSR